MCVDPTIVRLFVSSELDPDDAVPRHGRGRDARARRLNANQNVNAWTPTSSQVFAGHYVETNPYNPVSYAQNNTGRGGH